MLWRDLDSVRLFFTAVFQTEGNFVPAAVPTGCLCLYNIGSFISFQGNIIKYSAKFLGERRELVFDHCSAGREFYITYGSLANLDRSHLSFVLRIHSLRQLWPRVF